MTKQFLLSFYRYTKCPTSMPIHHYSPLDFLPTPSRWFRDTMKVTPRDKPVTRVLQVRAVSPFPETLIYQGCEPPPENAPSPPQVRDTSTKGPQPNGPIPTYPSVSSGGGAKRRGLNLLTSLQPPSTPPVGQGRGRGLSILALLQSSTPPVEQNFSSNTADSEPRTVDPRPPNAHQGTPHSSEQYQNRPRNQTPHQKFCEKTLPSALQLIVMLL